MTLNHVLHMHSNVGIVSHFWCFLKCLAVAQNPRHEMMQKIQKMPCRVERKITCIATSEIRHADTMT